MHKGEVYSEYTPLVLKWHKKQPNDQWRLLLGPMHPRLDRKDITRLIAMHCTSFLATDTSLCALQFTTRNLWVNKSQFAIQYKATEAVSNLGLQKNKELNSVTLSIYRE